MSNKGLAFSLGGVKKVQAAKARPGLSKPAKSSALAIFDTPEDEEQEDSQQAKRQRVETAAPSGPRAPVDPEVEKVALKLAEFVARNGRQFEEVTRQRNPGDSPFKFLFELASPEYKWYDQKVLDIKNQLAGVPTIAPAVQTPQASAGPLPHTHDIHSTRQLHQQPAIAAAPAASPAVVDPIAAMEAFAKKAAQAESDRQQKEEKIAYLKETSYDRRTVKAIYKEDGTRGHHMQDFIPQEELAKVLAKSGDTAAQEHAKRIEEQSKISSDNIGHKLLSKMGWKEGSGLGAGSSGMAAPISATGNSALEKRGLGAKEHTQIEEGDDEFEQYRKRMMLGYKHRPNPLGNPRKNYY